MQISHEAAESFFDRVSTLARGKQCNLSMNREGAITIQHPSQDAIIEIERVLWEQGYRYKPYIPNRGAGTIVYPKDLPTIVWAKLEILLPSV